jgi:hypothetical protein
MILATPQQPTARSDWTASVAASTWADYPVGLALVQNAPITFRGETIVVKLYIVKLIDDIFRGICQQ